jgi:UDP-N-acetylglucosamine 2-epimerase (non-hydrolysing)
MIGTTPTRIRLGHRSRGVPTVPGARPSNVLVLIGTRPEAIKMFPVVHAMRRSPWFNPVVVTTGQHRQLVGPILELAGIDPDVDLGVGRAGLSLNDLVAEVIQGLDRFLAERFGATGRAPARPEQILDEGFPAAALVHGDTSSALGAALAAFHLRIPVGHVEAGLRTWSTLSPFPEELNRQVIARLAAIHFAPTSLNAESLVREGVRHDQIFVTGNTGVDAMRFAADRRRQPLSEPPLTAIVDSWEPIVVVTAHRRENWNGGLARVAEAIGRLARINPQVKFVVVVHPNPIVRDQLGAPLAGHPNVICTGPLGYTEFARLISRARAVITDSGGVQEEAPSLGVPVLVTRETTERNEGVADGSLLLVGTNVGRIVTETQRIIDDPASPAFEGAATPYGDGMAGERIVGALEYLAGRSPAPVPFGPGFSRASVLQAAGYLPGAAKALGARETSDDDVDRCVVR